MKILTFDTTLSTSRTKREEEDQCTGIWDEPSVIEVFDYLHSSVIYNECSKDVRQSQRRCIDYKLQPRADMKTLGDIVQYGVVEAHNSQVICILSNQSKASR